MKNITPHNATSRAVATFVLPCATRLFVKFGQPERSVVIHFICCQDQKLFKTEKEKVNDQLCFESHQMDVCDLTRSHTRGRSALHDEQGGTRNQARLHQPEFNCPSHDWCLQATKEKVNPNGFQKSIPINQSPSAASQSRAAELGLFYFKTVNF